MKIYVIVQIYYIVDFVLVGPWFFSDKEVFHVNPCVFYFSVLVDILPRLISGFFPNKIDVLLSSFFTVVSYSDVDWAGSPTDRHSISGYYVFIGRNLIS